MTSITTNNIITNSLKINGQLSSSLSDDSIITILEQEGSNADINLWIHYWYHVIGVNVLPAFPQQKKPSVDWKEWQDKSVDEDQLNEWKKNNKFQGLVILPGKVWRGENKGKYLIHIDLDKKEAIDWFCRIDKNITTLEDASKNFLVEQHKDNPERAHVMFYSSSPFPHKSPDEVTGMEIKGEGNHGLACCTPSVHKNGFKYEIIGTLNPATLSDIESAELIQNIKNMCKTKGVNYSCNKSTLSNEIKQSLQKLQVDETISIEEGTRHYMMVSIADSLLIRHSKRKGLAELKNFYDKINNVNCKPPLNDSEINSIWNDSTKYVKNNRKTDDSSSKSEEEEQEESRIEKTVKQIMNRHHFLTFEESKETWVYQNGVYVKGGDILIDKLAEKILEYDLTHNILSEIKGHIKRLTYRPKNEIDSDLNIINLKNGLYGISRNELMPHSPDYYSIIQKPISHNQNAKSKLFGRFLSQVLYPTEIRTAVEAMAYTFYRDCPFEHFFKLHGYGANGKSVFTGLLTRLHGERNVSNVSLLSLLNNRFALSDLEYKDINVDTELSTAVIKDTSLLKKLTGGRRQPIRTEQKYQKAYDTFLYAKLFFNANTLQQMPNQTAAEYRREIIISFPNTFEGKSDDPYLLQKLSSDEELSAIFNVMMHALRSLLKEGIYLNEKTIEEKRIRHERAVNPVKAFIGEAIDEESTESDYIIKADLYYAYIKYCKQYSIAIKPIESLGKDLKKLGWEDGKTNGQERRTCWKGRRLKPRYTIIGEQQLLSF